MADTNPSLIAGRGQELISFWPLLHDGTILEIEFLPKEYRLRVEVALGFPDAESIGKEVSIVAEGVNSVYATNDIEAVAPGLGVISTSVTVDQFKETLRDDQNSYWLILDADGVMSESGVALQLGSFGFGAKSWTWIIDGVEHDPADLIARARLCWDKFYSGSQS